MIYANDNDAKVCEWMRHLPLAIAPQLAAEFIRAFTEAISGTEANQ